MSFSGIGTAAQALASLPTASSSAKSGPNAVQQTQSTNAAVVTSTGGKDGDGDHGDEGVGGRVNVLA